MAYKSFKPYTPGRRQMTVSTFDEITTDKPEKSLLAPVHNHGGRNGSGKMTVRHQAAVINVSTESSISRETRITFRLK